MVELPSQLTPADVNADGEVVGWAIVAGSSPEVEHAHLWRGGALSDLGVLGVDPGDPRWSRAHAVNDDGLVVGDSQRIDGTTGAFIRSSGAMTELDGGFAEAHALGVNNAGQVAGWVRTAAGGAQQAVLWDAGNASLLGTLGGDGSRAEALNAAGQVVGAAAGPTGQELGFLWHGGLMIDLDALVRDGSDAGCTAWHPLDINDAGWIVGTALRGADRVAFILKPLPNPPGNLPPTPIGDAATMDEDATASVSPVANDFDSNQDALRLQSISRPSHGSAVIDADGETVIYTPDPNWHGVDCFEYVVSDGNQGGEAVGEVVITVEPVNDPPVSRDIVLHGPRDTTLSGSADCEDPDGTVPTVSVVDPPTHGVVSMGPDGSFTYTPEAGWFGVDSFTYRAHDQQASSLPATATLHIEEDPNGPDLTPPTLIDVRLNGRTDRSLSGVVPREAGVMSVELVFSEPVVFDLEAVALWSVDFSGGVETLGDPLTPAAASGSGSDTIVIALDGGSAANTWLRVELTPSNGIVDLAGNLLDGDPPPEGSGRDYLYSPADDLPSGDGAAGGAARFYVASFVADIDGDRAVGLEDLSILAADWGGPPAFTGADLTGDGTIGIEDISLLAAMFGQSLPGLPA